ncbi:MAG TPA: glycosyltransferase family 2 protein [Acidimicrobiales bacterium]|nr:glycosyltransferase family 2 protein [Acidimicrobiales bacterium]
MGGPGGTGAVVVDHDAGAQLRRCIGSLLDEGAGPVVVVENGAPGSVDAALAEMGAAALAAVPVQIVRPGRNLGYGAGVNRGLAALAGEPEPPEFVLVSNPDLIVHPGALAGMRAALVDHPAWAIVGPRIFTDAEVYPSVRNFPSFIDAAGHALLAQFNPENSFTKRYNPGTPEGNVVVPAGWVSGSCFLARRSALEELGGFDEAYFMYAEDMDLCWRAHQSGWGVGFAGTAEVDHVQGLSTARHPYRMMAAHHRSALRFTMRTTTGWRRLALPAAVLVLGARMAIATVRLALSR